MKQEKIRITDSAASSLIRLGATTRIFYGLAIDSPGLYNAGAWSVVLGGLLAFPLISAVSKLRSSADTAFRAPIGKIAFSIAALIAAYDAAFTASAIAGSASYIALNDVSLFYLLLPQLALCAWCLLQNGDAIGASAGLWNRILPWLFLIVVLVQFSVFEPAWLTPVFGPGLPELTDGALCVAGWLSLPAMLLLVAEPDESTQKRYRPLLTLLVCILSAVLLMIRRNLLTPPLTEHAPSSRYFMLDALLSNGRVPLSLQLPMTVLWFTGLFYLQLFDAFVCAAMLQRIFPSMGRKGCTAAAMLGAAGLILLNITGRAFSRTVSSVSFIAIGSAAALLLLSALRKGGSSHA